MKLDSAMIRFMSKVRIGPQCWEWMAAKKGRGYGAFYFEGKLHGAHRISLLLLKGVPLNPVLDVMHSCDNPGCVNPDHLSYGTATDNMRDASAKGRTRNVSDWQGQKNPKAKLEEHQFAEIVRLANGGASRSQLAKEYGISAVRVCQILKAAGMSSDISASEAARRTRLAKATCRAGHSLTGENLRVNKAGARICKQCEREAAVRRKSALAVVDFS